MTAPSELILANIIREKLQSSADLNVLTFVQVGKGGCYGGCYEEEIRSYQQLWDNGQRVARALYEERMDAGHPFALIMQNHPEFVEVMVGSSIANTVFVPIDPRTKGDKLQYMLSFARCKGVVVSDYALPNLLEILPACPQLKWMWTLETGLGHKLPVAPLKTSSIGQILAQPVPNLPVKAVDPNDAMQMLYTSGTTGDPKAILAPHARFGSIAALGPVIGLQKNDRPYTGLSLTHANAQLITLGNILKMSLRGVISRQFTKSHLWDICRHYGCTMFNLLGGMTTAIYAEPCKTNDRDNPVRYVFSAGMPAAIWDDFKTRFGVDIYEFYGTAEGGLTLNPPGGPAGSIGKAPPGMICAILDEQDEECAVGIAGEICFRNADGSAPAVEYFRNPQASARKIRDGWFRTGDIGHTDEGGWIYFDYRAGGGIRRNGDFVNPAFVEKAIGELETVSDVFVYGVHTAGNAPGEKEVIAAIVTNDHAIFSAREVFEVCRQKLESNFVPSFLQVVKEIPKTASEKPQEHFLSESFDPDSDDVIGAY